MSDYQVPAGFNFGRMKPQTSEQWRHVYKYGFARRNLSAPASVEVWLPRGPKKVDQGNTSGCVGGAFANAASIFNNMIEKELPVAFFDFLKIYKKAQSIDGFTHHGDDGTTIDAGARTLKLYGAPEITGDTPGQWDLDDGVDVYDWAGGSQDLITWFGQANPQPAVMGTDWIQDFMSPVKESGRYVIGRNVNWKKIKVLGGHASCIFGVSTSLGLLGIWGTWDPALYPAEVYMTLDCFDHLMGLQGECSLLKFRLSAPTPPPPPPPPPLPAEDSVTVNFNNVTFNDKPGKIYSADGVKFTVKA